MSQRFVEVMLHGETRLFNTEFIVIQVGGAETITSLLNDEILSPNYFKAISKHPFSKYSLELHCFRITRLLTLCHRVAETEADGILGSKRKAETSKRPVRIKVGMPKLLL